MYFIEAHSPGDSGDTKLRAQKPELLCKIRIACRVQRAEYGSPTSDGQRASDRSARSWEAKLNEYGIDISGFTMVPP